MKNLLVTLFALMALFVGFSCTQQAAQPPAKFSLNRPFPLNVGQTGECADVLGFSIRFDKVAADSRCPQGVECITAGKADIVLTLTKTGSSQTVTLPFTLPNGTSNVTDFNGHTIRVMGVSPIKFKDKEIKPEEYNIVLSVIETPPAAPGAKPGEPFSLSPGESIHLDGEPTTSIRLDSIADDSRCPEGTQCIWAGKVDVALSLTQSGQTQPATLSTGDLSKGGKGETDLGAYTLKIKDISPTKKQAVPIPQKDYKATFVLERKI